MAELSFSDKYQGAFWRLVPIPTSPAACKAIASARLKNDKVDARALAQLLRVDLFERRGSLPVRFES